MQHPYFHQQNFFQPPTTNAFPPAAPAAMPPAPPIFQHIGQVNGQMAPPAEPPRIPNLQQNNGLTNNRQPPQPSQHFPSQQPPVQQQPQTFQGFNYNNFQTAPVIPPQPPQAPQNQRMYQNYGQPANPQQNYQQPYQQQNHQNYDQSVKSQQIPQNPQQQNSQNYRSYEQNNVAPLPKTNEANDFAAELPVVHPSVFRCTLSGCPESSELLDKCRLPFGITIQPFRDMRDLTVLQTTTIVRCRYCRAYINPYVYIMDLRHWKCNLCHRANELPDEFNYDPVTKTMANSPTSRPEMQNPTIEYIASNEYMLRPPQPAIHFFIFDTGATSIDCGLIQTFSEQLSKDLEKLAGVAQNRAYIGFLGVDTALHFFQWASPDAPPKHMIMNDYDEPFCPVFDGLVVPLPEYTESVRDFVQSLPELFETISDHHSRGRAFSLTGSGHGHTSTTPEGNCLGAALQVIKELIAPIGGRITVLLASIPNLGQGALCKRDGTGATAKGKKKADGEFSSRDCFVPQSDFYKALSLECTRAQIAIDLFVVGSRFVDLATLAETSKHSSGTVYHFPGFHFIRGQAELKRFKALFNRYLVRRLGLESVLRIRCTRGLSLHSFYGHGYVRSTDLLVLPNVSPDQTIGVQVKIEEPQNVDQFVFFQAALLYTSTKGDRRIRVHTLALPIISDISRLFASFDVCASTSLLGRMAVERAMQGAELSDCREALINACVDALTAYNRVTGQRGAIATMQFPQSGFLRYFPLYVLGLLKNRAIYGSMGPGSATIDERVAMMLNLMSAPLDITLSEICPSLYSLAEYLSGESDAPQRLSPSYQYVSRVGIYALDTGSYVYLYVCCECPPPLIKALFGLEDFHELDEIDPQLVQDEDTENTILKRFNSFIEKLKSERMHYAPVLVIREDGPQRELFTNRLVEDRTRGMHSLQEFMQFLQREINTALGKS